MKYNLRRRVLKTYYSLTGKRTHKSETSKVRSMVIPYCNGYGCDIGFGGDKIVKENCVGIDYPKPYTKVGEDKVDIGVDLFKENIPVADNTFDYVYSSHLIEDFEDTDNILKEHIRILKNEGLLILVFPDQNIYERYCRKYYLPLNAMHKHKNMGLAFIRKCIAGLSLQKTVEVFSSNCDIDYNVVCVYKIYK